MGFRFRRSVKLLPGLRLDFSKSGVSSSVGARGAHVTVGYGQVRETVGLPGTGLTYTETHSTRGAGEQLHHAQASPPGALATIWSWFFLAVISAIVLGAAYLVGLIVR